MFLPNPKIDQLAAQEFGEQAEQQTQYDEAQENENRILSSVENRLQKANYYRLVLENPLFADGETEAAYQVEAEFRNFALERLQILMGERKENPKLEDIGPNVMQALEVLASFSPAEIVATKLWAEKMLQRDPSMAKDAPAAPAPKLNTVQSPAPTPSLNVVGTGPKKPAPRKKPQPKIEPRQSSFAAAAQALRKSEPVVAAQPAFKPRAPQPASRQAPVATPARTQQPAPMPAPQAALQHFQQPPVTPPVAPPTPPAPAPAPAPQVAPQPPQPQNEQEVIQAQLNSSGAMVDHLGRSYEERQYEDHRTGEVKIHRVYHNSQVKPVSGIAAQLYEVPNERAALIDLAAKDTQGASMVMRIGGGMNDRVTASTAVIGGGGAITHFQRANAHVREE